MQTSPVTCLNYIGGQWLPARTKDTAESRNPADWRELVATFPRSGASDVDIAVDTARRAYQEWRLVPAPARADLIYRVGEILLRQKEEIAYLMSREMGKPPIGNQRRRARRH
jgi:alpha-ketoglutaric semialdehyde dehydrogenase